MSDRETRSDGNSRSRKRSRRRTTQFEAEPEPAAPESEPAPESELAPAPEPDPAPAPKPVICVICYNPIELNPAFPHNHVTLQCNHTFCIECLFRMREYRPTNIDNPNPLRIFCPLCRQTEFDLNLSRSIIAKYLEDKCYHKFSRNQLQMNVLPFLPYVETAFKFKARITFFVLSGPASRNKAGTLEIDLDHQWKNWHISLYQEFADGTHLRKCTNENCTFTEFITLLDRYMQVIQLYCIFYTDTDKDNNKLIMNHSIEIVNEVMIDIFRDDAVALDNMLKKLAENTTTVLDETGQVIEFHFHNIISRINSDQTFSDKNLSFSFMLKQNKQTRLRSKTIFTDEIRMQAPNFQCVMKEIPRFQETLKTFYTQQTRTILEAELIPELLQIFTRYNAFSLRSSEPTQNELVYDKFSYVWDADILARVLIKPYRYCKNCITANYSLELNWRIEDCFMTLLQLPQEEHSDIFTNSNIRRCVYREMENNPYTRDDILTFWDGCLKTLTTFRKLCCFFESFEIKRIFDDCFRDDDVEAERGKLPWLSWGHMQNNRAAFSMHDHDFFDPPGFQYTFLVDGHHYHWRLFWKTCEVDMTRERVLTFCVHLVYSVKPGILNPKEIQKSAVNTDWMHGEVRIDTTNENKIQVFTDFLRLIEKYDRKPA